MCVCVFQGIFVTVAVGSVPGGDIHQAQEEAVESGQCHGTECDNCRRFLFRIFFSFIVTLLLGFYSLSVGVRLSFSLLIALLDRPRYSLVSV